MLDALNRNYRIVLLRDCTLASDTPEEATTLAFTQRMITWAGWWSRRRRPPRTSCLLVELRPLRSPESRPSETRY
jgi:hypothetical protein